ncbi:hypothetical protein [Nocardioides sp. ChNu-99]|uniref:hypothetical protein n=1 Tax=Nocardioides sp. ChNu-99 TaxID=2839897 RepID=UPI002404A897|nr:hypothetical protein [Nocardioides sp. ChNu-99]MDF9715861.1 hypothetical protein [Nocardioides sp. ChNu-99]
MSALRIGEGLTRLGLGDRSGPPAHLVGVPFVCTDPSGAGDLEQLRRARVLQCALSRVCAVCAQTLTHPLVLVGTPAEADDNAFRVPPVHPGCSDELLSLLHAATGPVLGHPVPAAGRERGWTVVATGGFDLVRPGTRDGLHVFRPNSVVERRDDA